jgi:hypothetical protein
MWTGWELGYPGISISNRFVKVVEDGSSNFPAVLGGQSVVGKSRVATHDDGNELEGQAFSDVPGLPLLEHVRRV